MDKLGTTTAANRGSKSNVMSHRLTANYIKSRINPRDFYCTELPTAAIKKQGWNDGGICPFHADRNPGSFQVNAEHGAFKCFACGTKGGDIIDFTIERYRLSYRDALTKITEDWGLR